MAATRTTLLILGASGDLTSRLLLPGVATLLESDPRRTLEIVGADLAELSADEWISRVSTAMTAANADGKNASQVVKTTRYVAGDATDPKVLGELIASIPEGRLVIYFALPPQVTQLVCETLVDLTLPEGTILGVEKPFGTSGETAAALNTLLTRIVPEEQIFRVDHFLGLHTVLNLLGLRFANRLFDPVWHRDSIERVEIFYDEGIALEGRAGYYDRAGALRDMLQSHLLQILAFIAMDPPPTIGSLDLRDAVAQVLRATHVIDPVRHSRRARYTEGTIGSREVPSYVDEDGVDAALRTETLAEIQVEVRTHRWAGVPFVLRSGKALGAARKQAVLHLRPPAHVPTGFGGVDRPDSIEIDFRPDTFTISVTTNGQGDPFTLEQTELHGKLGAGQLEPYGEVIGAMLDGDPRIAVRGDAAEECWRIVEPVLAAWKADRVPLAEYVAGSKGPRGWRTNRRG